MQSLDQPADDPVPCRRRGRYAWWLLLAAGSMALGVFGLLCALEFPAWRAWLFPRLLPSGTSLTVAEVRLQTDGIEVRDLLYAGNHGLLLALPRLFLSWGGWGIRRLRAENPRLILAGDGGAGAAGFALPPVEEYVVFGGEVLFSHGRERLRLTGIALRAVPTDQGVAARLSARWQGGGPLNGRLVLQRAAAGKPAAWRGEVRGEWPVRAGAWIPFEIGWQGETSPHPRGAGVARWGQGRVRFFLDGAGGGRVRVVRVTPLRLEELPRLPEGFPMVGGLFGAWSWTPEKVTGEWGVAGLAVGLPGGGRLEGGEGAGSLTFSLADGGMTALEARYRITRGEWLVGEYYGDFARETPQGILFVNDTGMGGEVAAKTVSHAAVHLPAGGGTGRVLWRGLDLGRLHALYLQEPWQAVHPGLGLEKVAGSLAGEVLVTPRPGLFPVLTGRVTLAAGRAQGPGWAVAGIDLDLPLAGKGEPSRTGSLRLTGAQWGKVSLDPIMVPLVGREAAVAWESEVSTGLLGGRVTFRRGRLSGLSGGTWALSGGVEVEGVEVAPLLGMPGRLDGVLDPFVWQPGEVETRGEVTARVFGGRVTASSLSFSGLATPVSGAKMELRLTALDLEALTGYLKMGGIRGTLSGEVTGLEFAGWTPVAFDARVESVPGEAPQKISVAAIENLQVLGGGMGPGALLQRGLLSLFDEYGYRRLGFQCRLKNDTFYLTGVERRDGLEILVAPTLLPPRVEVVGHSPVIGWEDMIARLRAVAVSEGARPAMD